MWLTRNGSQVYLLTSCMFSGYTVALTFEHWRFSHGNLPPRGRLLLLNQTLNPHTISGMPGVVTLMTWDWLEWMRGGFRETENELFLPPSNRSIEKAL